MTDRRDYEMTDTELRRKARGHCHPISDTGWHALKAGALHACHVDPPPLSHVGEEMPDPLGAWGRTATRFAVAIAFLVGAGWVIVR